MNSINLSTISDCYIGNTEANAIYFGSILVWQRKNNIECKYIECKYNVTSTTSTTKLLNNSSYFASMSIDGVEQSEVVSSYTFNTTGEHTVLFTLAEGVTSIGSNAFYNCQDLISIEIPNSVMSIGEYAFQYCISLTSIDIPNSVMSIREYAFANCTKLTSITIPNTVTDIGGYAFSYCIGLTSATISNSVTSIGDQAFANCSGMISITIGNGVTNIGYGAFRNCTSLTSIISIAPTAPTIKSDTFQYIKSGGTLTVPIGSTGYDVWMGTGNYYLGKYNWTKVE